MLLQEYFRISEVSRSYHLRFDPLDIMLCGHHMRTHLDALLENDPKSFWIEPCELWSIKGVKYPK